MGGGLNKFEIKTQIFKSYKNIPGDPNSISSNNAISVFKDRSGNLWIGTDNGLNKFNKLTETFTVYGISTGDSIDLKGYSIRKPQEDMFGNLWLPVIDYGFVKFEPGTGRFTKYDPSKTLRSNSFRSMFMDLSEVLWVGTLWEGLHKYNPRKSQFLIFTDNTGDNKMILCSS
jgi:ligand-binding sensor domain-containing protein